MNIEKMTLDQGNELIDQILKVEPSEESIRKSLLILSVYGGEHKTLEETAKIASAFGDILRLLFVNSESRSEFHELVDAILWQDSGFIRRRESENVSNN